MKIAVTHRIDDLENRRKAVFYYKEVTHRIDDLEKH